MIEKGNDMKKAPKKAIPGSDEVGPLIPAGWSTGDDAKDAGLHCSFCHRSSKVVALWGTIIEESGQLIPGYVCEDCKSWSENKLGIEVGDIYSSSWGYDQTNVEFYEVVAVTKSTVKIRQIRSEIIEGKGLVPASGRFLEKSHLGRYQDNPATVKRPRAGYRGEPTFYADSHQVRFCSKWHGEPRYDTVALGYAGH